MTKIQTLLILITVLSIIYLISSKKENFKDSPYHNPDDDNLYGGLGVNGLIAVILGGILFFSICSIVIYNIYYINK